MKEEGGSDEAEIHAPSLRHEPNLVYPQGHLTHFLTFFPSAAMMEV
jgi:hypothetical protein